MQETDVSVVINLHREGYLLKPTFDSAKRAIDHAASRGYSADVVVVLDQTDQRTAQLASAQCRSGWLLLEAELGDLGLARNLGVRHTRGHLVAFLDGDDIWSANWLTLCIGASAESTRTCIWHPEVNLYFGEQQQVFVHIDMEDPAFSLVDLALNNAWTALCCTRRDVLERIPYIASSRESGIGFEDWSWNIDTIENGIIHKIVPGTGHAIRKKVSAESLLEQTKIRGALPKPSYIFRQLMAKA